MTEGCKNCVHNYDGVCSERYSHKYGYDVDVADGCMYYRPKRMMWDRAIAVIAAVGLAWSVYLLLEVK